MPVRQINGLSDIIAGFDALILDLWGVIHDGVEPYAGARETLAAIRQAGKQTILLSNAPRRSVALIEQLARMGIERDLYDHVLSSGEAVHLELRDRQDPFFAALGPTLYHLGPDRDQNVYQGLDYTPVGIDRADFILNTGPLDFNDTLQDYRAVLEQGIARHLPMVCANPDVIILRQGQEVICAGAIANAYAEMGGQVVMRGKPDPAIYAQVLRILNVSHHAVLAVGDALHTDIKGASSAEIRSVLVTQGIHSGELGIRPGQVAEAGMLRQLVARHGERPMAAIPTFRW